MAIIKEITNPGKKVEKGNTCAVLEMQAGAVTMKNSTEVSSKPKEFSYDPAISHLGIYAKGMKSLF